MKRLSSFASILALTATTATASAIEVTHNGEFRARYFNYDDYVGVKDQESRDAYSVGRFMYDLGLHSGDSVSAHFRLLNNNEFGGRNADAQAPWVNRAYGVWTPSEIMTFRIGRMDVDLAGGKFFSENKWEAAPLSFDGLHVGYTMGPVGLNLYALSLADDFNPNATDQGENLFLLSADIHALPEDMVDYFNVHFALRKSTDNIGTVSGKDNLQHVGLAIGGSAVGFLYELAAGVQFGDYNDGDDDYKGHMFDILLGYHMPEMMNTKFTLGYHLDSGNDSDGEGRYQPLYYNHHYNAGRMDVLRWGNLSYFSLGVEMEPAHDLKVGLAYYHFSRTEDTDGVNVGVPYTIAGSGTDKALGGEVDLWAKQKYDNGMHIKARLGLFMPGDYFDDNNIDQTMMQFMLQAGMTF